MSNFLETGDPLGQDIKAVYRSYATVHFIFCIDQAESELGTLDLIHIFVEALNQTFPNVCELDLIYHMDKVSIYPFPTTTHTFAVLLEHLFSQIMNLCLGIKEAQEFHFNKM